MAFKQKDNNRVKTPKKERKVKERPHWLRLVSIILICVLLVGMIAIMILARVVGNNSLLYAPESFIGRIVAPIQTAFAGITDSVVSYLRQLKLRSNLELEYNSLKAKYDQTVYQAMLADELQNKLSVYENLLGEMSLNESMQPVMGTVIGRSEGNYFSTFEINKGAQDGIEELMAVTVDGALVGYTYDVQTTTCKVRTIIDSGASIHCLIKSSRDQGSVKGTLGIDGTPMCRMYYLSESLPRPGDTVITSGMAMSFPKGIPVGTVRESTRGMDSNKQYIVVEPLVDFSHIEYVIVYRYKPVPEAVEGRGDASSYTNFAELATPRPVPTLKVGADTLFPASGETPTPIEGTIPLEPVEATATPQATATPVPTPTEAVEATPTPANIEYQVPLDPDATPKPSPVPTATPTPTPVPTVNLDDLTIEED
ncbi:MAG: rod shape-determining protein MreC [Clostridia bacterium]|nr:rod shape-determining protein MreC [Clostridia bacterium]